MKYNALQAVFQRTESHGLQYQVSYTYAKCMSNNTGYYGTWSGARASSTASPYWQNIYDVKSEWAPCYYDETHNLTSYAVYELPFGKGKTWLADANKGLDYVVGGWQLSNTTNWSSGLPWTPSFAECGAEQDVGICRPNPGIASLPTGVGDLDKVSHTRTYFTPVTDINNNLYFRDPGVGKLGTLMRNSYHGPSGFYSDLSVVKNFPIKERLAAQFRFDAFNVFNHPVYAFSANNGANGCIDCQGGNNGKITDIEGGSNMRELQFAIKLTF